MDQSPVSKNDDELRASNELLKLRLEREHGMRYYESNGGLSPELENKWLRYICDHEELFEQCGRITVYDYINRPPFTAVEDLEREQVTPELERLLSVMRSHGIQLDCMCEYSDRVIYQFVTTELFGVEMDNIRMPGLVNHFTYEDFHMNNQYEIERIAVDLIKSVYNHEWRAEYDSVWVGAAVKCNGISHDFHGFSSLVTGFQQRHSVLEIRELHINEVSVDELNGHGQVAATLVYLSQQHYGAREQLRGDCIINFRKETPSGYWNVIDINMPGITLFRPSPD
ncbi:MAG TPA: hypothetical protein VF473_08030 [Cyclobacteriaceae bacterium]